MSIGDDMWADLFRLLENLGLSEDDRQAIADLTGDIEHQAVAEARKPLVAVLRDLVPSRLLRATNPFGDDLLIDLSVPAFDDMYCGHVRLGEFRRAAALAAKEPP